jgi:hypothetical protein
LTQGVNAPPSSALRFFFAIFFAIFLRLPPNKFFQSTGPFIVSILLALLFSLHLTRCREPGACVGLSIVAAAIANAEAQQYPSRPITIVVPGAAGGPGDTLARLVAEPMRASLGQQIIIENVSGANGTIGTTRVVRAAADGYTLSLGNWNSHMAASAFYPVQYDILKDLDPISLLTISRL